MEFLPFSPKFLDGFYSIHYFEVRPFEICLDFFRYGIPFLSHSRVSFPLPPFLRGFKFLVVNRAVLSFKPLVLEKVFFLLLSLVL